MAYELVQRFKFEKLEYSYDRSSDVLDLSFGPPAPAVALQVEDWLAIRIQLQPPTLQGMTIVGFKTIFEKINRYVERELPRRMKKLANIYLEISISYDDQTDALIIRANEKPTGWRKLFDRLLTRTRQRPSVFEKFSQAQIDPLANIYVEKALPSKRIVGLKILEFTKSGPAALEAFFAAIIDTMFDTTTKHDENTQLITQALIQRMDWAKFARLAAS